MIFKQDDVEAPADWSPLAVKIAVTKYFHGDIEKGLDPHHGGRETSIRQLVHRVVHTVRNMGERDGYFASKEDADVFEADLKWLCINQYGAFNSPVWFNVGLHAEYGFGVGKGQGNWFFNRKTNSPEIASTQYEYPQGSACFLNPVEDTLESIMELAKTEAMLFKYGSGTGTDLSTLRSSKERLSGGGRPSGPLSFLRIYDQVAGIVKSGGRTRRAAKLDCLHAWHPDIEEFIKAKPDEEKKAWALIDAGYDGSFNGDAYGSVMFQNENLSVKVSDEFMEAAIEGREWWTKKVSTGEPCEKKDARTLLTKVAEGTHLCGDPGLIFHDQVQKWHTVPNSGEITTCNPCQPGFAPILTRDGIRSFDDIEVGTVIWSGSQWTAVKRKESTGIKPVFRYQTRAGAFLGTAEHRVIQEGERVQIQAAETVDIACGPQDNGLPDPVFEAQAVVDGLMQGDGSCIEANGGANIYFVLNIGAKDQDLFGDPLIAHLISSEKYDNLRYRAQTSLSKEELPKTYDRKIPERYLRSNYITVCSFLRGLYSANGSVCGGRVTLKAASFAVIDGVQNMLSSLGIRSYYTTNPAHDVKFDNGTYLCRESYDLNITTDRKRFQHLVGFIQQDKEARLESACQMKQRNWTKASYEVVSVESLGDLPVWDIEVEAAEHTYWTGGLLVSNCAEFYHLDSTACNLASLNLMKFKDLDGRFDIKTFKAAIRLFITAQEIIVDNASYPTAAIAENSHRFRPLGLGYANLGALIMSYGLGYDSDEGRALAGSITAILTGHAYEQSAAIASFMEPFPGYHDASIHGKKIEGNNVESMMAVMEMHRDRVDAIQISPAFDFLKIEAAECWEAAIKAGKKHGYRNAQCTNIAPTGCLVGESLILSSEGLLPLQELGDCDGDQWQDRSFHVTQESKTAPVTKFYVNGMDKTYRLETARGHELKGTWKHQLRVITAAGDYSWRRMEEIQPDDIVVLRLGGHEDVLKDKPLIPMVGTDGETTWRMDDNLAEIVGFYMGNGYTKQAGGLHLIVPDESSDVMEHFDQWGLEMGYTPTREIRQGCQVVVFNSRKWCGWMEIQGMSKPSGNHGEGAAGAFIPSLVLKSRTSVLASFLRGLFEADGTVTLQTSGAPVVEMSTVSPTLARQVMVALEALGCAASHAVDDDRKSSIGDRPLHRVRLASVEDARTFAQKIGFISKRKRNRLNHALEKTEVRSRSSQGVVHQVLIDDLYAASSGMACHIRQDISARKQTGKFSPDWVRQLIDRHPRLSNSAIGKLLELGNLQFVRVKTCQAIGMHPTFDLSVPDANTYLANGFVSHNTIGFFMDCDTTGLEPDLALVKYKLLAGGGTLKIVNNSVRGALKFLGYSDLEIRQIEDHIEKYDTIESVGEGTGVVKTPLHPEHLPVFDCAFKPHNGKRSLHYRAHLKIMSAILPFLCGSASKTINMPESSTVDDIRQAYIEAWKMGLKSVAIYRDGSKRSAPLNVKKVTENVESDSDVQEEIKELRQYIASLEEAHDKPVRRKMPDDRDAHTHKFEVGGHKGYLTVGMFPDGTLGELFVQMNKEGSTIGGLMDTVATITSIALQYGVPLDSLVKKFAYQRFEPSGYTKNPDIRSATSITDYIFRYLGCRFIPGYRELTAARPNGNGHGNGGLAHARGESKIPELPAIQAPETFMAAFLPDPCGNCGSAKVIRAGACGVCTDCGSSQGCS